MSSGIIIKASVRLALFWKFSMESKVFIITTRRYIWIVLILASCCRLFAADPNAWEQLNLSSARIAGTTIYYEKSLEEKLPVFQKLYKDYCNKINTLKKVLVREKITAEIYDIVGPVEFDIAKQLKAMTEILSLLSAENQTFYLVRKEATKDYLRKGGKLPHMSYDKETDMVTQYFGVAGQLINSKVAITNYFSDDKELEILIPIETKHTFEKDLEEYFGMLAECFSTGVLLHETIEPAILKRWRPENPYWRWFSDGFANAITIEILKKYSGDENAEEFAKAYDLNEHKKLEKEINLRYWMGLNFCIQTPLEYESELRMARYTYATYEAQQLIEKHGIDCVRKILDEVCTKKTRTGQDILQAIKKVTGEDIQQHLNHYQTFETRKEGMAKYTGLFNTASDKKDYEQMLINLLRMLELQDSQISPTGLRSYKEAALLLFKLGHEEAADEAMHNCVELFKNSGMPMAGDAAMETFIIYAFNCKNAKKAEKMAEELLKTKPNHLPALTVQMVVHAEAKRLTEAKQIAKKILNLDKNEQSIAYKTASYVLATDPNQQELDK